MLSLQFTLTMKSIQTTNDDTAGQLEKANQLIHDCKSSIEVGVERGFLNPMVLEQNLVIVGDDVDVSNLGDEYESYLKLTPFKNIFKTPDDIYYVLLHAVGHRECDQWWRRTSVKRDLFPEMIRELVEDMWIQRQFYNELPTGAPERMYEIIVKYDKYRGFKYQQQRDQLHSLLTQHCSWGLPFRMRYTHQYLYESDVSLAKTFDVYMHNWHAVLNDSDCADSLKLYQQCKG